MQLQTLARAAGALLIIVTTIEAHKGAHDQLNLIHRRHREQRQRELNETVVESVEQHELQKRGQCTFPANAGLVAVTPGSANGGWAMSPDQPCHPGTYCPYACPPGQVSVQWDPKATSYSYPQSMNGGLYCDSNGQISKPFPDKPYCQSTATNIGVVNNAGSVVSFCQTVLPGNEAMLIPTTVDRSATLAVPGTDYWCGTAAHYYINPPGIDAGSACVWGTKSNPWGNWSPYVAGTNVDASGNTFIKLGWNPIYLETATPFRNTMPNWGVKIECPNGGCNGLPCGIDPSQNSVNNMFGSTSIGAGGASFCVVTVSKGSQANFVVTGGGGGGGAKPSDNNNPEGKGGQFYTSNAAAPISSSTISSAAPPAASSTSAVSSSLTTRSTSSSTTKSTTSSASSSSSTSRATSSRTLSSASSSTSSNVAAGVTTTWEAWNVTSAVSTDSAGSVYYTSPSRATAPAGNAGATTLSPSPYSPQNGATRIGMSAFGLAAAVWVLR